METSGKPRFTVVHTQGPHDPFRQAIDNHQNSERTVGASEVSELDASLAAVPPRSKMTDGVGMVNRASPFEILKELAEPELTDELKAIHQRYADAAVQEEIEQEKRLRAANLHTAHEAPVSPAGRGTQGTNVAFDWQAMIANIDNGQLEEISADLFSTGAAQKTKKQSDFSHEPSTIMTPPPSSLVERGRARSKVVPPPPPSSLVATTNSSLAGMTTRSRSRSSSRATARSPSVSTPRKGNTTVRKAAVGVAPRNNPRSRSRSSSIAQSNKIAQEMAKMRSTATNKPTGSKKVTNADRRGIVPLLERIAKLSGVAMRERQTIGSGQPPPQQRDDMIVDDEGEGEAGPGQAHDQQLTVYREMVDRLEQKVTGKDRAKCFLCNTHKYFVGSMNLYTYFRSAMDEISVRMSYEPEPVLNECADFYKDFRDAASVCGIELPEMDQAEWLDHLTWHIQVPEAIRYQEIQSCQAITQVLRIGIMLAAKHPDGFLDHRLDLERAKGYAIFSNLLNRWMTTKPSDYNIRSQGWVGANIDPKRAPMLTLQSRNDPNSMPLMVSATNMPVSMQLYQGMAANGNTISTNASGR